MQHSAHSRCYGPEQFSHLTSGFVVKWFSMPSLLALKKKCEPGIKIFWYFFQFGERNTFYYFPGNHALVVMEKYDK